MKKAFRFLHMFVILSCILFVLGLGATAFSVWLDFVDSFHTTSGYKCLIALSPFGVMVMCVVSWSFANDEAYHEKKKVDGCGTDSKSCCGSSY